MVTATKELAQETKLRIAILKELKYFMRHGTTIEFLKDRPEIFYNSVIMSKILGNIIDHVKNYPIKPPPQTVTIQPEGK